MALIAVMKPAAALAGVSALPGAYCATCVVTSSVWPVLCVVSASALVARVSVPQEMPSLLVAWPTRTRIGMSWLASAAWRIVSVIVSVDRATVQGRKSSILSSSASRFAAITSHVSPTATCTAAR